MAKFKEGDVVQFTMIDACDYIGEGILGKNHGDQLSVSAWRYTHKTSWWYEADSTGHGELKGSLVKLHPDADQVLADFTAWKLLGGANK